MNNNEQIIILNEKDFAEKALYNNDLGRKPFDTLYRIARMKFDDGLKEEEVRSKLNEFILRSDSRASLVKWSDVVNAAIKRAKKYPLIEIDYVLITNKEKEVIDKIESKVERRLAFTLLAVAKFWLLVTDNKSSGWVNLKDTQIMKLANISTSLKRQSSLFSSLNKSGLIQFSNKVDNLNTKVLFIDYTPYSKVKEEDCFMKIEDFRNLGWQFLMRSGENGFFVCECCGIISKKKNTNNVGRPVGRPEKFCTTCKNKNIVKSKVNYAMGKKEIANANKEEEEII